MPGPVNKLQKLTINAFSDPQRNQLVGGFFAMFNPQSVKQQASVNYSPVQGINTSGRTQHYNNTPPTETRFTLLLDATGPMFMELAKRKATVASEIARFEVLALNYNGKIHQPNYLTLNWDTLDFNCRLQSLTTHYCLFDEQGKVLSAELECCFISDETSEILQKKENKQSPDMTHVRYITAAADLSLIAAEIYDDPEFYLALAQYNQLDHFRDLPYGQKILCPPLELLP